MIRLVFKKAVIFILVINILGMGFPQLAQAGLIGTEQLIDPNVRVARVAQIERVLAHEEVLDQFLQMGVSPEFVQARLAALTDHELQQLETHLNQMPAGGIESVLAVIGIVFVILIILEVVGVTDIFKKI